MDIDLTGTPDVAHREWWTDVDNPEGDVFVLDDGADPDGTPTETDVSAIYVTTSNQFVAARWTCLLSPVNSGIYKFRNVRDDLGRIKLRVTGDQAAANSFNIATTDTISVSLVAGRWYYYEARWYNLISSGNFYGQFMDPIGGVWRNIATIAGELTIRKWVGYVSNAGLLSNQF